MKRFAYAVLVLLFAVLVFLPIELSNALVLGDTLPDGIVVESDSPYCGCCHEHQHEGNMQWFLCLFCRIVHLFDRSVGVFEQNIVHKYAVVQTQDASCVAEGKQDLVCLICGKKETVVLEKTEHIPVIFDAVAPTCTSDGLTQGSQCDFCGEILIKQESVPATGHSYEEQVIEALTCLQDGNSVFTCSVCSDSYSETYRSTGHCAPVDAAIICYAYDDEHAGELYVSFTCLQCHTVIEQTSSDKKAFVRNNSSIVFYQNTSEALVHSKSGDTVVVAVDDSLFENATVPQGVTLLIPCDNRMSGYAENGYPPDNPTAEGDAVLYRTLTIADGVTLTVKGTVLINAVTGRVGSASYLPYGNTGYYGQVNLAGEIVVENGGVFDCAGFVRNAGGRVTLKSGATMYETYAIAKWRGGSAVVSHFALDMNIMPIYEWSMNNMQASLRVESGATLCGSAKMHANDQYYYARYLQIAPTNALFRLTDGAYVIREIDAVNNREVYSFYGDTSFAKSEMNIAGTKIGTDQVNFYTFDGDMTFNFYEGEHKITKSFAFLPGAQVNIFNGATLKFNGFAGFAMFDQGFYEIDQEIISEPHRYTTGRPNAVLHIYSGGTINANGNKSELMGAMIVEEGAVVNTNDTTVTQQVFRIPKGWHVNGSIGEYTLLLKRE